MTIKEPVTPSAPEEPEIVVSGMNDPPMAQAVIVDENNVPAYAPGASGATAPVVASSINTTAVDPSTSVTTYVVPPPGSSTTGPASSTVAPAGTNTTTTTYTVPPPAAGSNVNPSGPSKTQLPGLTMNQARINCPHCQQDSVTNTRGQVDCCTIVGVVVMVFVFWPLFWLPFVLPCCKTTEHYCSKCHRKVGAAPPCQC